MTPHNDGRFNKLNIEYWRGLLSGDDFHGQTLASCIRVIHADIVGVWNLPNKDRVCPFFSSEVVMLCLLGISVPFQQGVQGRNFSSCSGFKWVSQCHVKVSTTFVLWIITGFNEHISIDLRRDLRGLPIITGIGERAIRPLLYVVGFNPFFSTEKIRLVVGYIIDLTFILCRVFNSRNVSPLEVQSAINDFAGSSLKTSIHNDIRSFIKPVPQFESHDNDVIVAKIRDVTLRNCEGVMP